MKNVDKKTDKLFLAWRDLYTFYSTYYLPENQSDWDVMYDEANQLCRKWQENELVCLIVSAILTYAEKRKRGEIDG